MTMSTDRIADPSDLATQQEQRFLDAALTVRKPAGPVANGECHTCGAEVGEGHRWCDKECLTEWEADQVRIARAGSDE